MKKDKLVVDASKPQIKHPDYYAGGIEAWDFIVSNRMGFIEGNVIKYVTRYRKKGGLDDLLKAREYLDKLIEEVDRLNNDGYPL